MYCKWIQWRLSGCLDHDRRPSGRLLRHLQTCTRCRKQYEQMVHIERHLQIQEPALLDFEEKTLCKSIMARLPESACISPLIRRKRGHWAAISAAGLAAVLLMAAGLWLIPSLQKPDPDPRPHTDRLPLNRLRVTQTELFNHPLVQKTMQQPLENEWQSLTQDVQKAVRFFAGCLPNTGLSSQPSPD